VTPESPPLSDLGFTLSGAPSNVSLVTARWAKPSSRLDRPGPTCRRSATRTSRSRGTGSPAGRYLQVLPPRQPGGEHARVAADRGIGRCLDPGRVCPVAAGRCWRCGRRRHHQPGGGSLSASTWACGRLHPDPGNSFGLLNWTPSAADVGSYPVTFTATTVLGSTPLKFPPIVESGSVTVAITVTAEDSPPIIGAPVSRSGYVGTSLSFGVSATDPDGDALTALTAEDALTPGSLPAGATFTVSPRSTPARSRGSQPRDKSGAIRSISLRPVSIREQGPLPRASSRRTSRSRPHSARRLRL